MIEVYSGLYVNEATDLNKPEQMDQVSEKVCIFLVYTYLFLYRSPTSVLNLAVLHPRL